MKSITIDLNGHQITSSNSGRTIYMNQNAYLKLTSSAEAKTFKFAGYDSDGKEKDGFTVSAGGLVTNSKDGGRR